MNEEKKEIVLLYAVADEKGNIVYKTKQNRRKKIEKMLQENPNYIEVIAVDFI